MYSMKLSACACCATLWVAGLFGQGNQDVTSMTKMNVRVMGPGIRPGSYAALPKLIYRAGPKFARHGKCAQTLARALRR